jgi:hypothetical protein
LNSIAYQNPFDFSRDHNWSSLDSRHQASGYVLWQAPFGMEFGTLFQYRSGLPIDATTGDDTSELLTPNLGNRPLSSPGVYMLRNSFRNRDFRTTKKIRIHEDTAVEVYGDLFNLFNFANVAFVPSIVYRDNPAFIYGPGVLPTGGAAPVDTRFLRLRTATGAYAPVTTYQQGRPFEAQLGVRLSF